MEEEKKGASEIASLLRREIMAGEYITKDRLPSERVLATKFRCARGTMRMALKILAEDSLVQIKPKSGTYVRYEKPQSQNAVLEKAHSLELIDARFALEPHICRLVTLQATQNDIDRIATQLHKTEQAEYDIDKFSDWDTEFHTMLVEITQNSLLIWMLKQVNLARAHSQWSKMRKLTLDVRTIREYNAQHQIVLEAIRSRDPEGAASAMKEHLESARQSLRRAASA